ncbi:uncharacterized protein EHS24_007402 [Apiotrichum porosum]|uniref:Uncharacterized protein n=1 Tax=Apiotrichum porosum TaxID=105984 RepID=A0A427XUA9_9TREE|nr:uncharacterized protein EHS24_007402 [Apiotrichum porosum]RSH82433.1 hypothetical protein EHS24_007402 [Apiotrichum porosum]
MSTPVGLLPPRPLGISIFNSLPFQDATNTVFSTSALSFTGLDGFTSDSLSMSLPGNMSALGESSRRSSSPPMVRPVQRACDQCHTRKVKVRDAV